jgi:hypothetical protein
VSNYGFFYGSCKVGGVSCTQMRTHELRVSEFHGYRREMTGKNTARACVAAFYSYLGDKDPREAVAFYQHASEYFLKKNRPRECAIFQTEVLCQLRRKIQDFTRAGCFWELHCPAKAIVCYELLFLLKGIHSHLDQTRQIVHNNALSIPSQNIQKAEHTKTTLGAPYANTQMDSRFFPSH